MMPAISRLLMSKMKAPKYEEPTMEALTLTFVNVGFLWSLNWMQILTVFWYGFPFHSTDLVTSLSYYLPLDRWSLSLPELFLALTVFGVAVLITTSVFFTRNTHGRFRMLLTIGLFSVISVGFSLKVLQWQAWHCENARNEIAHLKNYELPAPDDARHSYCTKRITELESLLRQLEETQDKR